MKKLKCKDSAIRALGSLFKLTEVYIWEDGSKETREVCLFPEFTAKSSEDCHDNNVSSTITAVMNDFGEAPKDLQLTKEMDALGLPLSFQSNKKTRSRASKSKRKGNRSKISSWCEETIDEEAIETNKVSETDIVSPTDNTSNSLSCMSILGQSEPYCYDVAVDASDSKCLFGEESTTVLGGVASSGNSHDLSSNNRQFKFATLCHGVSNEENRNAIFNSDAPSSPCQLVDASVVHVEKEIGGSLEFESFENSLVPHDHKKVRFFCGQEDMEQAGGSEIAEFSQNLEVLGAESQGHNDNLGDWRVCWDTYYMRNYFYNIQTGTSTWDPPAGMEHLAYDGTIDGLSEVIENDDVISTCKLQNRVCSKGYQNDGKLVDHPSDMVSMETGETGNGILSEYSSVELQAISENGNTEITSALLGAQDDDGSLQVMIAEQVIEADDVQMEIGDSATDKVGPELDSGMMKQKKKARKILVHAESSIADNQCQDVFEDLYASSGRYWRQRYLLFSRFDSGIRMDEEGWFSVTPELIARHQALRCSSDIIIDGFTGVGGNAIQFAQSCKHVIAIDLDPRKINYANDNASIYGVDGQIDFITGDFFIVAPKLKADTIFLSPPWGGPDYAKVKSYNIMTMLRPRDGYTLFNTAKKIARKIVMFLPRNTDLNQLAELTLSDDHPWSLEVERNYLNGKLKAITAYFSDTTVDEGTESPKSVCAVGKRDSDVTPDEETIFWNEPCTKIV